MSFKELRINQQIVIEIEKDPYQGKYPSKIAEINRTNLKVMPPYLDGEIINLRPNIPLYIHYTDKNAAYKFRTGVIDQVDEPVPLLTVCSPNRINRMQRRDHFRLDVKRKLTYRRINQKLEPTSEFKETSTVDLSGGGVKMILPEELPLGTVIELFIDLPEIEEASILGKIMQFYELPNGKAAGIEFISIKAEVRELIINWLFDYQRILRHRGLL